MSETPRFHHAHRRRDGMPLAARAQQAGIGFLGASTPSAWSSLTIPETFLAHADEVIE